VSTSLKARAGKFAYWLAGGRLIGRRLPEFDVEADGSRYRCSFALLSKVRNYGGDFEIARSVSLFDDQFEMVLFEGRTTAPYVKYLAGLTMKRLHGMKGVVFGRAREVTLTGAGDSRIHVQIDGELAGGLPATIKIVPEALTLMVPPAYGH
jgi:diacylglycerol kinase (ATP)